MTGIRKVGVHPVGRVICTVATMSVILGACATTAPDCRAMENRSDWARIAEQPAFVDDEFLAKLLLSGRTPEANRIAWYTNASGQYIACEPGDRRGCGDITVLLETDGRHPKERTEEITLCGEARS